MAPKPHGDIRFLRRVLIATAVFALALLAWYLVDVLLLIFGAVLIAVLLRALADSIAHRTALSQTWALIPATLGILLVVAASGTLFAVVAFGLLFGPLGILFATPLAVVAMVAIKRLWVRDALGEPTDLPGD